MVRKAMVALFLLTVISGCPRAPVAVDYEAPEIPPSVLGPDDLIDVRVHLEDSLSGEFRLDAAGSIDFPLLSRVSLAGLLPPEAARAIRDGLADGFLNDPQVTVSVKEFNSRMVSVIGEVKRPGRLVYRDGMTVLQAIAEAGGTSDSALLSWVQVTRSHGDDRSYDVPYKAVTLGRAPDFVLIPGDVVLVQESAVR
jgi:protein involved in polysaccharide export with SLBB domain